MQPVGQLWGDILSEVRRKSSETATDLMKRICRRAYYDLAKMTSWATMRETVEMDFTSTDELWLPADLIDIDGVQGQSTDAFRIYYPRNIASIIADENTYRYKFSDVRRTPFKAGADLVLASGATTFTAATLTTDYTGDFICFGDEPGYYELTAQTTIANAYYGPPIDADGVWQVRPTGTKQMTLIDPAEETVNVKSNVFYTRLPMPLYREEDIISLPNARILELLVLIRMTGNIQQRSFKANDYKEELYGSTKDPSRGEGLLGEVIRENPDFSMPMMARGVTGEVVNPGANIFSRRDGRSGSVTRNNAIRSWLE